MVSRVYAEPTSREPRSSGTPGVKVSPELRARPAAGDAASLVCSGTFAIRRALWLAGAASRGPVPGSEAGPNDPRGRPGSHRG